MFFSPKMFYSSCSFINVPIIFAKLCSEILLMLLTNDIIYTMYL